MSTASDTLAAIEQILARVGDADDALREVVAALHRERGYRWAGIFFVEGDDLVLGPEAPEAGAALAAQQHTRTTLPVTWQGTRVAELAVDDAPEEDRMFLERVAVLVAGHCLVGWDTGGETWEP